MVDNVAECGWSEFLHDVGLWQPRLVRDLQHPFSPAKLHIIDLSLMCQKCGAVGVWKPTMGDSAAMWDVRQIMDPGGRVRQDFGFMLTRVPHVISWACTGCRMSLELYFRFRPVQPKKGEYYEQIGPVVVSKLGALWNPAPRVPTKLIGLLGPSRELLQKGKRAEMMGLGVGAFAYYRQCVEHDKDRLLGAAARIARQEGDEKSALLLESAGKETQFHKAMQMVAAAVPRSLMIAGQNPFTLLHSALSDGLHARDDATCLERAHDVRTVLAEFARKVDAILRDDEELRASVGRLSNPSPYPTKPGQQGDAGDEA